MSVSRTAVRLIATFVASGAIVGAAALPALAVGADHDHGFGRSYSHDRWDGRDHDGHFRDRDRRHGWDRNWDRDRHHGWDRGWDRDRRHGWDNDRYRDHDRYFGHR
ncbi:hypothetical protein [Streptomyces sp. NPDC048277]|uniref:hypothetical protein n=1 Tax=Streptomyces sp. NPDC048277 TaxID=3155027 RepID=UPI0033D6A793